MHGRGLHGRRADRHHEETGKVSLGARPKSPKIGAGEQEMARGTAAAVAGNIEYGGRPMSERQLVLTHAGLQRLEEEMRRLQAALRGDMAEHLRQAASYGNR